MKEIKTKTYEFRSSSLYGVLLEAGQWVEENENLCESIWDVTLTSDEENAGLGPWFLNIYCYDFEGN